MIGLVRFVDVMVVALMAGIGAELLVKTSPDTSISAEAYLLLVLLAAPYACAAWALGQSPSSSRLSLVAKSGMVLNGIGVAGYAAFARDALADKFAGFIFFAGLIAINWLALSIRKATFERPAGDKVTRVALFAIPLAVLAMMGALMLFAR